jgi:hypothetical protein
MEVFLDYLLMVLPALRIDMFLRNTRPARITVAPSPAQPEAIFALQSAKHGLHATARLEGGEFIVEAGSLARASWVSPRSVNRSYGQLYAELLKMGVLRPESSHCVFSENYAFKSPSAAASIVYGRPTKGPDKWKVQGQSMTYKEWEAAQLTKHELQEGTE